MSQSSLEALGFEDAPYGLQTYYCYVRSWVESIRQYYKTADEITNAIDALKSVQKIQGGRILDKDMVAHLTRGRLTLKAMESIPITENPELAPTANLWLPVQAYYAIHGIGLATMLSLGQSMPRDHRAFKSAFSDLAGKYLPAPLSASCARGPHESDFKFNNIKTSPQKVKQQSNLSNPRYSNLDCLLGKCLSTTRTRFLEESFNRERRNGVRPDRKRRNLSVIIKQNISGKLHPTTIVDFLYRMRIRSNYQEPDIHLYASKQQTGDAVRHYNDLLFVTRTLAQSLSYIIQRRVGKTAMEGIEKLLGKK